jgi:hypothetical protein
MRNAKALVLVIALHSIMLCQEIKFIEVKLPSGVSIDVPRNWWVIGGDLNQTLETSAQAVLDLTGVKNESKTNLLRANSMPRSTYAAISINFYENPDVTPNEIRTLSLKELKLMDDALRSTFEKGFKAQGVEVLNWYGTKKNIIDGKPALVTEYRRSGGNGAVFVQINSIYGKDKMVRLTLSYRESENLIWKPVVERMRVSFKMR